MAQFKTFNNDYIIELSRVDAKVWFSDISYKYICKFKFFNNIGNFLFEILCSEIDIFILLDNLYNFSANNLKEVTIPLNSSKNGNFIYLINFTIDIDNFDKEGNYIYHMNIIERNIFNNSYIIRAHIKFDLDHFDSFVDMIYFIYLIDIDCENNTELMDQLMFREIF